MSTDYYVNSPLSKHTLARAAQVNTQFVAVETGLALLPGKDKINESRITYLVDTGAADAYVVTLSPVPATYTAGMTLTVKMSAINTGACTINVNDLGTRAIKLTDGTDPGAGNIVAGLTKFVYDGTSFVIMSVIPGGVVGNYNPAAVEISGGSISGITDLAVADGGTGSSTAADARTALAVVGTADKASVANYREAVADKWLDGAVWSAGAEVTLTDEATIAVDMETFLNAVVTLTAGRTLGNPSNTKVGQSGYIRIVQDSGGSNTLAYASSWEFDGGTAPTLTTAGDAEDMLFYMVLSATRIYASLVVDIS